MPLGHSSSYLLSRFMVGIATIAGTFTLTTNNETTVVTAGATYGSTSIGGLPSAVHCPRPVSIEKKAIFQLSLEWIGGTDAVEIPFKGADEKDQVTFDMTWSKLLTRTDTHVIIDVDGLDVDTKYSCKFIQADNDEIVKVADGAFLGEKGLKMDCGVQPTGFAISGASAAVVFELLIKGTKTKASYAGPQGGGPLVQLNTCLNGEEDGDETDADCGGPCSPLGFPCLPNQKCKADADCLGDIPCKDNVCGLDGLTPATAGLTCKSIVLQNKESKNGFYW
jgi:hypothetical protein